MVEKSWGSSGMTVPSRFGTAVSPYGEGSLPSTMGMLVYTSGQQPRFEAEGRHVVENSGSTRLPFATASSTAGAASPKPVRRYRCQPSGDVCGLYNKRPQTR